MKSLWVLVLVALVGAPRLARADELDDAKAFLASRPELATIANKVVTKVGSGAYRLEATNGDAKVFLVKAGGAWAAALTFDTSKLPFGALIPAAALGDAKIGKAFLVVGSAAGTFESKSLGGELPAELGPVTVVAGASLYAQLSPGSSGVLGQLVTAGLLPTKPMWLSGTLGGGVVEGMLGGTKPTLDAIDFSLTLQVPSMVPAPFDVIASPKLTLGEGRYTFARTGGVFSLAGEQKGTTLVINEKTIKIPRTAITFTTSGGSYDITVEGISSEKWSNAFGLDDVDVKSFKVFGSISSTKTDANKPPIKGFGLGIGARVSISKKDYDGQFSILVENKKLKELTLALAGDLNLGFLPGGKDFTFKQFGLAFTPGSQQVALAGELQWRSLNGRAAVVMSKQPILLLGLKGLDLGTLVGERPPGMPALPSLDVLLTAGFAGASGDVKNLPSVAQALVDEFTGATGGKVKLANGIGIVTKVNAKAIGGDKFGLDGPMLLAGSVDVQKRSFRLAVSLTSIPPIPGLPKGFRVEAPELFIGVDQKAGAPVGSIGLAMRLVVPFDKDPLTFKGSLAASSAGTFSFTGSLESDWKDPFGLVGITVRAPVIVTVGVGADASVDFGFQAGMSIAKQTYNPMAMCVNVQAGPAPVPKKLAIKFKGTELGPKVQLEILEALVKSVANGPLKAAALDGPSKAVLAQVAKEADKISEAANPFGISSFSFKNVDVALTTPGVTCELPAIEGMGIKLAGTATWNGKMLGTLDSYANLTQGFKLASKIADIDIAGIVKLTGASIDILAPMPGAAPAPSAADAERAEKLKARKKKREASLTATKKKLKKEKDADDKADLEDDKKDLEDEIAALDKQIARLTGADPGHFYLNGKTEIMRSSVGVKVEVDKTGAAFGFTAELADFGAVALSAETEGEKLTKATDFTIGLRANIGDKLIKKLGQAIRASAATRKATQQAITGGTDAAIKATQAEYDRLDAQAGKEYRAQKKALKKAKKNLKKARRAVSKAKDKCEEDLGVAADLCGAMDVATEALKAARKTVTATEDSLKAIKKSTDFLRLGTLKATLQTLKGGKDLAAKGLAGWAAIDSIGQMIVDGSAAGFLTVEELDLEASLRQLSGKLEVTLDIGGREIEKDLDISLAPSVLDVTELAEELSDEINAQALDKDSEVWKLLRAKKK